MDIELTDAAADCAEPDRGAGIFLESLAFQFVSQAGGGGFKLFDFVGGTLHRFLDVLLLVEPGRLQNFRGGASMVFLKWRLSV